MLNHLLIRNLAVVDEVEAEPGAGLTVLTGETGAGKSILIDALSLALGERADSEAVRAGTERAEIAAGFDIAADSPAAQWLRANDLDSDAGCLLRRVVTAEGRSRGYINGNPVPMQTLRELGSILVDICGQQAHQSLGKAEVQRQLLDQHGGLVAQADEVEVAYRAWQALQKRFNELEAARSDQHARLDLLRFQVSELEALDPRPGEIETLDAAHKKAANASKLGAGTQEALQLLYESDADSSAHDQLGRARQLLENLGTMDPSLAETVQLLKEAEIQVSEAADNLRQYLTADADTELDLAALEARLGALHDTARKHRVQPADLPELLSQLTEELRAIENTDDTLEALQQQMTAAAQDLQNLCIKLSKGRKRAATKLAGAITDNMRQLGMPEGNFTITLHALEQPGPAGSEKVEFRVAINPGIQPGALSKVASGGELSRISLAIQVAANAREQAPTVIFDEVDAGVGGGTADIVGARLRELAANCQVLCVTHLPQVACKGHAHFRVTKLSDGNSTRTRVTSLNEEERVEEIARMLGGVEITTRTREHAREMLESALQPQKTG